jgi:uncharacterized membrane protein YeaQ/YmgE (transglycosylase-associated protein family)
MSLQAQVFIIIMVVGFVLGGIAALSDKGRGLVTYLFFGVVGSSVGGALLVPVLGIQLITADPIVTTIVVASENPFQIDSRSAAESEHHRA